MPAMLAPCEPAAVVQYVVPFFVDSTCRHGVFHDIFRLKARFALGKAIVLNLRVEHTHVEQTDVAARQGFLASGAAADDGALPPHPRGLVRALHRVDRQ